MANYYLPRTSNQVSAFAHWKDTAVSLSLSWCYWTLSIRSHPFLYQGACNSVTQPGRVKQSSTCGLTTAAYRTKLNSPPPAGNTLANVAQRFSLYLLPGRIAGSWSALLSYRTPGPSLQLAYAAAFPKISHFPFASWGPLSTFFHTAAWTSSVHISHFSLSCTICKLAEGELCPTVRDFNKDVQ